MKFIIASMLVSGWIYGTLNFEFYVFYLYFIAHWGLLHNQHVQYTYAHFMWVGAQFYYFKWLEKFIVPPLYHTANKVYDLLDANFLMWNTSPS